MVMSAKSVEKVQSTTLDKILFLAADDRLDLFRKFSFVELESVAVALSTRCDLLRQQLEETSAEVMQAKPRGILSRLLNLIFA